MTTSATPPVLRLGDVSPWVGTLQERLNTAGARPTLSVDNDFGARTKAAVRAFQVGCRLADDGVVGPKTWERLLAGWTPSAPQGSQVDRDKATARTFLSGLLDGSITGHPSTRLAVLNRAIDDLGLREEPLGSNSGPQIAHLEPHGAAWCARAATAWVRLGLGADWRSSPFGTSIGWALEQPGHPEWPSVEGWGKAHGALLTTPEPGSILVMGRSGSTSDPASQVIDGKRPGHCGLVLGARAGRVWSVDGNVGDRVALCNRDPSVVIGYVRWW